MNWFINWLKWKIASKELARLSQLETDLREHRRWLSMFADIAMTLDNLAARNGISGGFNEVRHLSTIEFRELLRKTKGGA